MIDIYDLTPGKQYQAKLYFNNTRWVDAPGGLAQVRDLSITAKDPDTGRTVTGDFPAVCNLADGPHQIFDHQLKVEPFASRVLATN